MRKLLSSLFLLSALTLAPLTAWGQAACPIQNQVPQVKTGTTYTVQPSDICSLLDFTSSSPISVSLPNANTLPSGFVVWIKTLNSSLVATPTTSTIDGGGAVSLNAGGSIKVWGNQTNYYSSGTGAGAQAYAGVGTNILQNSDFLVDQVNAGASVTAGTSLARAVDRWYDIYTVSSSGGAAYSTQQVTLSSGLTLTSKELKITGSTATTSATAGMISYVQQTIEGADVEDLNWGQTTGGVPVTASIWLKSSIASANIGVALKGASTVQSYVNNCVLSSTASTWTECIFTIPAPTTGTWTITAGSAGPIFTVALQCGTTFQGTAGAWATGGPFYCTSAQTQQLATLSSTLEVGPAKVERGSNATAWVADPFAVAFHKDRRYYRTSIPLGTAVAQNAGLAGAVCNQVTSATAAAFSTFIPLDPPMYAAPTITTYSPSAANANWYDVTGSSAITVSVDPATAKGLTGFEISTTTTTPTVGHVACIHYAADAGL